MCYKTVCSRCRRQTWGGCGRHVEQIMQTIAPDDRCVCASATIEPQRPAFTIVPPAQQTPIRRPVKSGAFKRAR